MYAIQLTAIIFRRMGILGALKDFAEQTSIHGFARIVESNSTVKQRCFWSLVLFTLTMYASLELRISVFCKFDIIMIKASM